MSGWIKIHRKITQWEWYQDSKTLHLFIHLLLNANHKEKKWQGTVVKRGQLIVGRKSLAKQTGLSQQSVRTSITKLKSTTNITTKSTNRFTLVTIVNYDDYQKLDSGQPPNQPATQPTINQQATTNKNVKNEKKTRAFSSPNGELTSKPKFVW